MPTNRPSKPNSPYAMIGLIRGLTSPDMKKMAIHLRQQILINILLSYIDNAEITAEVWKCGFDSLSNELKATAGIPTTPPTGR